MTVGRDRHDLKAVKLNKQGGIMENENCDMGEPKIEVTGEEYWNILRIQIKGIELDVRNINKDKRFDGEQSFPGQHSEMQANIMLSVRHLEDARMRLGKLIQYSKDGVSCFDK